MRIRYNHILDNSPQVYDVLGNSLSIGRGLTNDISFNSPFVADHALEIVAQRGGWDVVVVGGTCQVGDKDLYQGDRHFVSDDVNIALGPFTMLLEFPKQLNSSAGEVQSELDRQMSDLLMKSHLVLLERMNLKTDLGDQGQTDEYLLVLERNIEDILRLHGLLRPEHSTLVLRVAGHALRSELLNELLRSLGGSEGVLAAPVAWSRLASTVAERESELAEINRRLAKRLELGGLTHLTERLDAVDRKFWSVYATAAEGIHRDAREYLAFRYFKKQIKDIVFGYGPLEDLLRIPTISEIMVVDRDHIYIERSGVLENSGRRFISDEVTLTIIERIVSKVGRRIDKSQPLVDARLIDGSRVNAVIPPLAVSGPCITIRKFPFRRLKVEDLIARGSLTPTVADFLKAAVVSRANMLIAGGTGSGKTTLLNSLSDFIPDKERIVTIEDTAELQLMKEHVVRLETKLANVEGHGEYTVRDLVKNALRMRPDRIIVGECRGAEALDMLQAMNTGHDGSMTTIHANSARDVILRLEVLVQMAADLPVASIYRQIASAIDLVVQTARLRDGSRRITQIAEIVDYDELGKTVRLKDLFVLETVAGEPKLCATGCLPTFMDKLIGNGLLQLDTFYN